MAVFMAIDKKAGLMSGFFMCEWKCRLSLFFCFPNVVIGIDLYGINFNRLCLAPRVKLMGELYNLATLLSSDVY